MRVTGNRHHKDGTAKADSALSVITAYSDTVYRLAYAMMKNRSDADDIYQEVFLRYIRREPVFQSSEHARAWMLRVTANCCRNHWKSPWADGRMEPLEKRDGSGNMYDGPGERDLRARGSADGPEGDPARLAQEGWRREQLRAGIGELPEKYRLVMHLYYYEEMSTEEIARLLRRRTSTVRTQLVRARERLRGILEKRGFDRAADFW